MSDNTLKLLDIVVKGLFGTLLTVLVTFYGLRLQTQSAARTQAEQRSQEIVSLETQQKDLDVKIAQDMFKSLTDAYLNSPAKPGDEDIQRRLLFLHLVALNFQDVPI